MFRKKTQDAEETKHNEYPEESAGTSGIQKTNVIVKGSKLTGDIIISHDLELDGDVEGNITSEQKSNIVIKGNCKGNIKTKEGNVDIQGVMSKGDIIAGGNVTIIGSFNGGKISAKGKILANGEFSGTLEGNEIEIGSSARGRGELIYKEHISIARGAKVEVHISRMQGNQKTAQKSPDKKVINLEPPVPDKKEHKGLSWNMATEHIKDKIKTIKLKPARSLIIKFTCCISLLPLIMLAPISLNESMGVTKLLSQENRLIKSPSSIRTSTVKRAAPENRTKTKKQFCDNVNLKFRQFGWNKIICNPDRWEIYNYSYKGNPIVYQKFGFDDPDNKGPVNLILCGVHGDEPPGVYLCFRMVREIIFDNPQVLKGFRLVIAPIVNPDGFFANTRQNSNGVDPNRNLPTQDWDELSHKVWAQYRKDPRKYPGMQSGSEPESRIQTYLISRYKPDKIISVHAPYGFLDFDGPGEQKLHNLTRIEQRAKFLGLNIEANSKRHLRLKDFRFFPGSLGNYAGIERNIPTYTVELLTADSSKAYYYWVSLKFAILKALSFEVNDRKKDDAFAGLQDAILQLAYNQSAAANADKKYIKD